LFTCSTSWYAGCGRSTEVILVATIEATGAATIFSIDAGRVVRGAFRRRTETFTTEAGTIAARYIVIALGSSYSAGHIGGVNAILNPIPVIGFIGFIGFIGNSIIVWLGVLGLGLSRPILRLIDPFI